MASLKLRDVLGFVEGLKAELRTARRDVEAQKSIVRGQDLELTTLRGQREALLAFIRRGRAASCDSVSGEHCDENCANNILPLLLEQLERVPGMAELISAGPPKEAA